MKKKPNSLAAQLHEASEGANPKLGPAPGGKPIFADEQEAKAARMIGAAVALHALLQGTKPADRDHDRLIDEAFAIADKFVAKVGP